VTAPLFVLGRGSLDGVEVGDEVVLDGPEGRHAVQVRRLGDGERVDVCDGHGTRAAGVVVRAETAAKAPSLVLQVVGTTYDEEPAPRFVLVQALAKGDRDLAAVEAATELGVDAVVPWQAERSVVVWRPDRAMKSQNRWAATVLAAAKQSRRSRVPEVAAVVGSAELGRLVAAAALTLVLHEDAERPLSSVPLPSAGDVLVVVGPEGGIGSDELERLQGAGAIAVRLGSTVLRSSTAGPAALAVLSARFRWA
jgi:16S rRNA (uracil1498-N3)-methyltransferase